MEDANSIDIEATVTVDKYVFREEDQEWVLLQEE